MRERQVHGSSRLLTGLSAGVPPYPSKHKNSAQWAADECKTCRTQQSTIKAVSPLLVSPVDIVRP